MPRLQKGLSIDRSRNADQMLPQELWDMVACYLTNDSRHLRNSSMACKALRQACRKFIWRHLRLWRSSGLESLFNEHPGVATFVQDLSVYLPLNKLSLLLNFKNVKSLTWSYEPDEKDDGVIPHTALLPPQDLTFAGVNDLTIMRFGSLSDDTILRFVACFPSIVSLRIDGYSYHRDEPAMFQREEKENIPLSLSHLRSFHFNYTYLVPAFTRITRVAGGSLKYIKVNALKGLVDAAAEFWDLSGATSLIALELDLGVMPTSPNWGDPLANALQHVNGTHKSLKRIHLHVPSLLPDPGTGLQRTWKEPGQLLGQQLTRVMDEVPKVVVTFKQCGSLTTFAANHAHGTLGHSLQRDFPGLTAFPKRLRFVWNIKVWSAEEGRSPTHNEELIQSWQV